MSDFKVNVNFGSDTFVAKPNFDIKEKANLKNIEFFENGIYKPEDYGADGFGEVNVDVQPTLEELTITENGTYTPQEGVAGFSKVTANVVPQYGVKTASISINGSIIDDDGWWRGAEYLDTSLWNRSCIFINFYGLKKLNVSNWDTRNWNSIRQMFQNCASLEYVDVSNWNTSNIISDGFVLSFSSCKSLSMLDVTNWDASSVTDTSNMFSGCSSLQSLIGNRTIEDVLENNITALNGLKVYLNLKQTILDRASLRAVINGLADLTGQTAQTIAIDATLIAKLTEEDIAIATNKNWTIV